MTGTVDQSKGFKGNVAHRRTTLLKKKKWFLEFIIEWEAQYNITHELIILTP